MPVSSYPLQTLATKLNYMKIMLRDWNKSVFGDLFANIQQVEDTFLDAQVLFGQYNCLEFGYRDA